MSWGPTEADFTDFITDDPCVCILYQQGEPTVAVATFTARLTPYVISGTERQAIERIGPATAALRGYILMCLPLDDDIELAMGDEIAVSYAGKTISYIVTDPSYFPEHWEIAVRQRV